MREFAKIFGIVILRKMKLPVFEEFILSNFDTDNIKERLTRFNAGKVPLFLVIADEDAKMVQEKLNTLAKVMATQGISTKIPYPVYVVTTAIAHHPEFIIASSPKELPLHFTKPTKRLNNKETAKLGKSDLLSDKIINTRPDEILTLGLERSLKMKEIKKLSKEVLFLENLNRELSRKKMTGKSSI